MVMSLGMNRARCSSSPKRSIIQDAMLWIEMYAAVETQPARQFLEDHRRVEPTQARAAMGLAAVDAGETEGGRGPQRIDGKDAVLVPLRRMRRHLLRGEIPGGVLEGPLVLRKGEIHGRDPDCAGPARLGRAAIIVRHGPGSKDAGCRNPRLRPGPARILKH